MGEAYDGDWDGNLLADGQRAYEAMKQRAEQAEAVIDAVYQAAIDALKENTYVGKVMIINRILKIVDEYRGEGE